MTQGIFVNGARPKFMKDAIAAIKDDPSKVLIEATSFFGNDYGGPVDQMPENKMIFIVGPDPQTRKWFMNVTRKGEKYEFNK